MTPSNANDETLGVKHKELNGLVQNAIGSQKTLDEKTFVAHDNDIDNLMKIDIASHNKDIDYILSVLKSEDMLYVSRAIKQSTWLVDDQYAHLINPDYLNDHLFPCMKTKASIKLLKHVRHYLKTENRVEEFYKNEKNPITAAKWLSRCSIPFIEANISNHMQHISNLEFKRLCERSITVFEAAMKENVNCEKLKAASFLLNTHPDKYLDVVINTPRYIRPTFGPAATELIMRKIPDRIINDFLKYLDYIHVPTFIKSIKREDIKEFLFKLANKETGIHEYHYRTVFEFRVIRQFVIRMPKEEQFEFVKKVFLDMENIIKIPDDSLQRGTEMFAIKQICVSVRSGMPMYHWYEFASFEIAFEELKKIIQSETNMYEKYSMLKVLLKCAGANTKDLLVLLNYYFKNFLNDNIGQKIEFVNKLLSQTEIYKYDEENWNAFMEIFKNMDIYTEHNNHEYAEIAILYHVLHDKEVTEAIEKSFIFNTLKKYRKKLNQNEQHKIFQYVYNYMAKKVEIHHIEKECDFTEAVHIIHRLLDVLIDWDKQLADYPFALDKIKELVRIRRDNAWKISLSTLYNKKKTWRRLMFEESVVMNPTQNVCVNALKHDPALLMRYRGDIEAICCNDTISLKQLLRKLRIYWSDSLSKSWAKSYLGRLDQLGGHKALIRGLCTLLSQEQLFEIFKQYAPPQPKIDWNNTNELTLGLQRTIAKNMHIARPQPSADAVLLFAKGDFLQYALPSLLAIYYNMGRVESAENIPKLLNAPVSLQKHGLRFAFIKLKHEELKYHLSNIWQTSKNVSIRAVSFVLLFDLLCKEKDAGKVNELWEILEVFIDNLSFKEDKKIYEKLPKVQELPKSIQPKFLIKSYKFLKSLLPHLKSDRGSYEFSIEQLAVYTRELMDVICPEFVVEIITEYLDANFFNAEVDSLNYGMISVLSSYLLCAKDEETQMRKYENILEPLIKSALVRWNEMHKDKYFIRYHFQELLNQFSRDLSQYVIDNKMVIPTKMFTDIQKQLDESLNVPQNYVMLRMWKLTVKKAEIMEKHDKSNDWQHNPEIMSEFGKYCLEVLKEDIKSYFSCIYVLYARVLKMIVKEIQPDIVNLHLYETMLNDKDFIPAFLLILKMIPDRKYYYCEDDYKTKENEVKAKIREHPTVEVKMHYYSTYNDENELLGL